MHTYKKVKDGSVWIYTVGFESSNGEWEAFQDFDDVIDAMKLINYLNGGSGESICNRLG